MLAIRQVSVRLFAARGRGLTGAALTISTIEFRVSIFDFRISSLEFRVSSFETYMMLTGSTSTITSRGWTPDCAQCWASCFRSA